MAGRWEELVHEAEESMLQSWLEHHLVPLRAAILDFEVRKLRAIDQAQTIARATASTPTRRVAPGDRFELWVSSTDGRIGGYIDQVLISPSGAILRDYKSGQIFEGGPRSPRTVKTSYEVQLKLYAALYFSMTGSWPARLELVPIQGSTQEVPFAPHECEALLEEALAAVCRVSDVIAGSSTHDAESLLANPGDRQCSMCAFRPGCDAYQRARESGAGTGEWPRDVWGTFEEARILGNGAVLVRLRPARADSAAVVIRGLDRKPERHPALAVLRPGDAIGVFGLKRVGDEGTFQESRWTVVYKCEERNGTQA